MSFPLYTPLGSASSSGTLDYAFVQDQKSNNTNGGTFVAGGWRTRTLNTSTGGAGWLSLSTNQITLQAGSYLFYASAPAYFVDRHQIKLRNVTDSTDTLIGSAEYATNGVADASQTRSFVEGAVTIGSAKAFEIQHNCSSTQNDNGFGVPGNFSVGEVFTMVEILKI